MGIKKEKTFALVCYEIMRLGCVGAFLKDVEDKGLTLTGLKLMNVSRKFAKKYISRTNRQYKSPFYTDKLWLKDLIRGPVVALLLEGEDAVTKAYQCSLESSETDFSRFVSWGIYCSRSVARAEIDTKFWFPSDSEESVKNCDKDAIFVFQNEVAEKVEFLKEIEDYRGEKFQDLYTKNNHRFILIRPLAVRERLVGKIMWAFKLYSTYAISGLKLVHVNEDVAASIKKSGDSSSTSGAINDDDHISSIGVAMVFEGAEIDKIAVMKKGGNHISFNHETGVFEIDEKLIYIAEPGRDTWELVEKCFHFGFVLPLATLCGPFLESSLVGL